MKKFRVIARHTTWVDGATISESCSEDGTRRFSATIRGFNNWRIWEGGSNRVPIIEITNAVRLIRDRIDANDEAVFELPMPIMNNELHHVAKVEGREP